MMYIIFTHPELFCIDSSVLDSESVPFSKLFNLKRFPMHYFRVLVRNLMMPWNLNFRKSKRPAKGSI